MVETTEEIGEETEGQAEEEEIAEVEAMAAAEEIAEAEAMAAREKCTRLSALTADRTARSPSSQQKESQFIAGTASKNTENIESNIFKFSFLHHP